MVVPLHRPRLMALSSQAEFRCETSKKRLISDFKICLDKLLYTMQLGHKNSSMLFYLFIFFFCLYRYKQLHVPYGQIKAMPLVTISSQTLDTGCGCWAQDIDICKETQILVQETWCCSNTTRETKFRCKDKSQGIWQATHLTWEGWLEASCDQKKEG